LKQKTEQEEEIVRFLLGELSDAERTQIEERFLEDNRYFEQICAVEDALVDDYVEGALTDDERAKVERLLRSSRRQAREIAFTRDLIESAAELSARESPKKKTERHKSHDWQSPLAARRPPTLGQAMRSPLFAAVALLLVIAAAGLLVWNIALQGKIAGIAARQAEIERQDQELKRQLDEEGNQRDALAKQLESEQNSRNQTEQDLLALQQSLPTARPNDVLGVELPALALVRSGGRTPLVRISPGISEVRFRINVESSDKYTTYNAAIRTYVGQQIWQGRINPGQVNPRRLILRVPAKLLATQDYILRLSGDSDAEIGEYPFRVRR